MEPTFYEKKIIALFNQKHKKLEVNLKTGPDEDDYTLGLIEGERQELQMILIELSKILIEGKEKI